MRNGTTLVELAVALMLLGVLTGLLSPKVTAFQDRAAVLEAREHFIALIVEVRRIATERGGAVLLVRSDPAEAILVAAGDTVRTFRWPASRGSPQVVIGGARTDVALAFDRAGLGRFANATIGFSRGGTTSEVVLSSYGRVRRR